MTQAFDAEELERRYAIVDQLPESLFQATATHLHGSLLERVQGVLQWQQALLQGSVPELSGLRWPERAVAEPLTRELRELRLPHFCRGEKTLTEAVLLNVLEVSAGGELRRGEWEAQILARLQEEERERQRQARKAEAARNAEQGKARGGKSKQPSGTLQAGQGSPSARGGAGEGEAAGGEVVLEERTLAALRAEAARLVRQQMHEHMRAGLRQAWQERTRMWAELEEVFGELSELLGRGWDLCRGLLRTQGWLEVARLRALLERLPALRELLRVLGRMRTSEDPAAPPISESILGPVQRVVEERQPVRTPLARSETRGLERSGDVQRMLPAEGSLLGHPTLRLLWHARRAERTLLTYRVEGVEVERIQHEEEHLEAQQRSKPGMERGPILVCLDTSGSMEGLPEQVAKALVLEALRVALAERRSCYVYAFSGPGQVREQELALTEEGLVRLMALLTQSFHGGTDVTEPLVRAVARLEEEGWGRADLLLVSDGEFAVPAATRELLVRARERRGLRAHGVLIGGGDQRAMEALCSPVHRFTDWGALLGATSGRRTQ